MATLQQLLVIENPDAGTPYDVTDTALPSDEHHYWSSVRRANHPWIAQLGEDEDAVPDISSDGQKLDPITGRTEEGETQVRVIDQPEPGVSCDVTAPLLQGTQTQMGLDENAYTTGGWSQENDCPGFGPLPSIVAFAPAMTTFALFSWGDGGPDVRAMWSDKTLDGTERGGTHWTPGQYVGFRFVINWTLDTGAGNIFVEVVGMEGAKRFSGLTPLFDFWTIPPDPGANRVDGVLYTRADSNGEIVVRWGAEGMAPSMNILAVMTNFEAVECVEMAVDPGDPLYTTGALADTAARQQLRGRRAHVKESDDGGATWTRILYSGYVQDITLEQSLTYLFTIGDTRRVERVTRAWSDIDPFNNVLHEKMTALIGGPVYQGWAPILRNFGLPIFRVISQQAATLGANGWVELQYRSGPLPPAWVQPSGNFIQRDAYRRLWYEVVNERAEPFHDSSSITLTDGGSYPGLRATLLDVATEAPEVENLTPMAIPSPSSTQNGQPVYGLARPKLVAPSTNTLKLRWSVTSTGTYPNGTDFKLHVCPREVSERWPVHYALHPVVMSAAFDTLIGESYDITAAADTKEAVGDHIVEVGYSEDPNETIQDVNERLFGKYQYSKRRNADGVWEYFSYAKIETAPSDDITLKVLREEGGPTYQLSDSTAVNVVRQDHTLFKQWEEGDEGEPPFDFLVKIPKPTTHSYSTDGGATKDADSYGAHEASFDSKGYTGWARDLSPLGLVQYSRLLAERLFDRHGRGAVQNTWVCRRGTDADNAVLGAAVITSADHQPNAQLGQTPTSQRNVVSGTSRWGRVIQRTEYHPGAVVTTIDDSTGVAYGEEVSLTVTPSATADPKYFYDVAIADITALHADAARLLVQVAVSLTVPTAGTPYTVLDSLEMVDDLGDPVDPWTETFGPFPAGATVWFRMAGFLYGGRLGTWSPWCHIGGCALPANDSVSNLVIDQVTDEGARLTWSYDESPQVGEVRVQYRDITTLIGSWTDASGSPFAAGTETTTLTGLLSGHRFEVRVVLVDIVPTEYGDVLTGFFFTTGGRISSLAITSPTSDGAKLNWTNTDLTHVVHVEVKTTAESVYRTFSILPAGSNRERLTGLLPSTTYDVQVSLLATGAVSIGDGAGGAALTDSFTTLAVTVQLEIPLYGGVWWDTNQVTGASVPGLYGVTLHVNPNDAFRAPLEMVIEEALETSEGSATAGTFAEVATVAAVIGGTTYWSAMAPNDGLWRYLRARSRKVGFTDSDPTVDLPAKPWSVTPNPSGGGGANVMTLTATALAAGGDAGGSFALPHGAEIFKVESNSLEARFRLYTDSATRTSDLSRPITDHTWPYPNLLLDGELLAADSPAYTMLATTQQRVRIDLGQHPDLLTYYTIGSLEAGTEDFEIRVYFFGPSSTPA